jgi:hypothetical protein
MGKVVAGITISVDGFITGPGDGPGWASAASACTTGCSAGPGATRTRALGAATYLDWSRPLRRSRPQVWAAGDVANRQGGACQAGG